MPGDMLYRASRPAFCWNERGAQTPDLSCKLPSFLTDISILKEVIRATCAIGVARLESASLSPADNGIPAWASRQLCISDASRDFLINDLQPWKFGDETLLDSWKKDAIRLVVYSFPVEFIDDRFSQRCQAYAPLLLPFLGHFLVGKFLRSHESNRIISACLSASKFAGKATQERWMSSARQLIYDNTPAHLVWQVELRQIKINQLFGAHAVFRLGPLPVNPLLNALAAERLQLLAQQTIEDGYPQKLSTCFSWKPLNAAHPSRIEEVAASHMNFLRGKAYRFRGHFQASQQCLELLVGQIPKPPCLFQAKLHLAAVYSELSLWERGSRILQSLEHSTPSQRYEVQLCQAELALSKCIATGIDGEAREHTQHFNTLFSIFMQQSLKDKAKPFRRKLLRCCMGIAVLIHLQSRTENRINLINALKHWQIARAACRECLVTEEGFPDLVCILGSAEIRLRLLDPDADDDLQHAAEIWCRLNSADIQQRFFLTSIGTSWANLLNDWIEAHGKPRVLPKWADNLAKDASSDYLTAAA